MITRWICNKDNKKWLYPIEKCIYCREKVTKQVSETAQVIGITKVNIPSPMHPIIPYNIVLLEDEFGNRIPKKTMKRYKIGDTYEFKQARSDDAVILKKIKYDVEESVNKSLELLNNLKLDGKVLIKVSCSEPAYAYQAVCTNPKVLEAVVCALKQRGIKDIIVAEQSTLGNTLVAAKKSGILKVCKDNGIEFLDLDKDEYETTSVDGFEFRIAKQVLSRKVVNVPVMKTNSQLGISGSVENLIRVTDRDTQKKMFGEGISKVLPKLVDAVPGSLTIGDASIGMHGNGPTLLGEPAFLNMLIVSNNPVNVDLAFVELGMLDRPAYLPNLEFEVAGDEMEASKFPLKPSENGRTAHPRIKIVDGQANPYVFSTALKMSSRLLGLLGNEIKLAIGPHLRKEELDGTVVAYGNEAIEKIKDLGVEAVEIPEDIEDIEKIVLLKGVLEKGEIGMIDRLKSKVAKYGVR